MSSKVRTDSETEDKEVQHGDSLQEERKSDDCDEKTKMKEKYLAAANDYYQLKFSSLRKAAIAHGVTYTILTMVLFNVGESSKAVESSPPG